MQEMCFTEHLAPTTHAGKHILHRIAKPDCCALEVFGVCYEGHLESKHKHKHHHKQCAIDIAYMRPQDTHAECHQWACRHYARGCCARIFGDVCLRGDIHALGCSLDIDTVSLGGAGEGSSCESDLECAVGTQIAPNVGLCARCHHGTCHVGTAGNSSACNVLSVASGARSTMDHLSAARRSWTNYYRNFFDSHFLPSEVDFVEYRTSLDSDSESSTDDESFWAWIVTNSFR